MPDEYVTKVSATKDKLYEVLDAVDALLTEHECDPAVQTQIEISLEELFVNIVMYAYPTGEGEVEVRAVVDAGIASITLIDEGIPFNPLEQPAPTDLNQPAKKRKVGGLGIYMMKKQMDDVNYEYRDGRNVLTFRKKMQQEAENPV